MNARDYERNSRIALAGYDAFHELSVVGAGTAREIVMAAQVAPAWSFVGVDPSAAMLDVAREKVAQAGIGDRVALQIGTVDDVHTDDLFDAATLIGVLHHVTGEDAKVATLRGIADRLKPGRASLARGTSRDLCGTATAPERKSESAVFDLLAAAGFIGPVRYFSSLFWGAWVAWKD